MNSPVEDIGRLILITGLCVAALGGLLMLSGKLSWPGRLPGDILIRKKDFTVYLPLATSLILSLVISLILYFIGRK